jgi:hypothetical protein
MSESTLTTFVDRSRFRPGPWDAEPLDKVHWIDSETDLDCLIVRNWMGGWCGYVGVAEGHPFFGVDAYKIDVEVHGGLNYAGRTSVSIPGRGAGRKRVALRRDRNGTQRCWPETSGVAAITPGKSRGAGRKRAALRHSSDSGWRGK